MDNVLVVGSLNMDFAVYMERESMIAHINDCWARMEGGLSSRSI